MRRMRALPIAALAAAAFVACAAQAAYALRLPGGCGLPARQARA